MKNEIYYSLANTAILSPQEIIRKCNIVNHVPGLRPLTSPWPLPQKDATEGQGISEADRFVCRLAVDPQRGLFYEFVWEAHWEHAKAAPPGDWSRWVVGVNDIVPETPKPKARIIKKRKLGTDSESDTSLASPSKRPKPARKAPARGKAPTKKKPRTKTIIEDEEFEPEPSRSPSPSGSSAHPSDASDSDSDADVEPEDSNLGTYDDIPRTPSKRKRGGQTSATTTPCHRRVRTLAMPTPHSKAALRARRKQAHLVVRPPPPEMNEEHYNQLQKLPKDPWLRAMHILHVAARPNELPCREEEYAKVLRSVLELVEDGSGGCVCKSKNSPPPSCILNHHPDISGVPGTGKTATVHAVVRELKRMAESNVCGPLLPYAIEWKPTPHRKQAHSLT